MCRIHPLHKVCPLKTVSSHSLYPLVARVGSEPITRIPIGDSIFSEQDFLFISGPCSVESEEQIMACARFMSECGVRVLRGGAFKPRSSPYSFQGLEERGLVYLQRAAKQYGMFSISEVMDAEHLDMVADHVDILQIGARNMQNFALLKKLGSVSNPVFLKRGMSATYEDLLLSAEYIVEGGNPHVILCERGIRTFEPSTRNTLDITAVPVLKQMTHLPVVVDPSHACGRRDLIAPLTKAAVAAGADGIMIESHPNPDAAFSDKDQTIDFESLSQIVDDVSELLPLVSKRFF